MAGQVSIGLGLANHLGIYQSQATGVDRLPHHAIACISI